MLVRQKTVRTDITRPETAVQTLLCRPEDSEDGHNQTRNCCTDFTMPTRKQ
ncbi:hypothetical protein DPMN_056622 [Dreissena polymorpha]|uniref:Uncharacterized protein n=1 Tax=Dreissena polymorpha TaxID=45954 RepID=A0A9D4HRP2_DREPO|nr:hypothetical protein DPMN_056622 [Dreissena polymorpha]